MGHLSKFNYQILGEDSSPKLIFLHGLMGRGRNFQSFAKRFSKKYQCLIFDQRGHGESFKPEKGYGPKDFAGDLLNILDELGWAGPVHLVGHSMGGRVALIFADLFPQRLKSLMILDIGPTSDWQSMEGIKNKVEYVPVPFASREEARAFFTGPFLQKFPNKRVMEFFYSNIREFNGQWAWVFSPQSLGQMLEAARVSDFWAEFKKLSMPTLLLRGELSTDLTQENYEMVLANNSNIQGRVVVAAGHWIHAENPSKTLEFMDEFLGRIVSTP